MELQRQQRSSEKKHEMEIEEVPQDNQSEEKLEETPE